jgi:hypothetical protein
MLHDALHSFPQLLQTERMNKLWREKQKRSLILNEAGEEDYLGFQNRCVRKFGPAAGIFIRQLVYWAGKEHDSEDGSIRHNPR